MFQTLIDEMQAIKNFSSLIIFSLPLIIILVDKKNFKQKLVQ